MVTLSVPSIHCESCGNFIKTLLSSLPLGPLEVNHIKRTLSFSVGDGVDVTSLDSLVISVYRRLYQAGYEASGIDDRLATRNLGQRMYDFFSSGPRARRRCHLRHCFACQQESFQGVPSSMPALLEVKVDDPSKVQAQETVLSIEGMTCSSCRTTISQILNDLPGVSKAVVDLVTNSAIAIHDSGVPAKSLISEIEGAGYGATIVGTRLLNSPTTRRTRFNIEGMTCSASTAAIQNAVSQLPGVNNLTISLITNSMDITHDPSTLTPTVISSTIRDLGYEVLSWDHIETGQSSQATKDERIVELKVQGMVFNDGPARANAYLESLNLISFTPLSIEFDRTKIHYKPSPTLTIREIYAFPQPFKATLYAPPSLMTRSRKIQQNEAKHLAHLFLVSLVLSIPTFIVGVLAMILLPERNSFRMWWETPFWGGATRATIALWIIATFVQFGVGWIFYKGACKGTYMRRKSQWTWSRLVHFGNMDLLVALSTSVAYMASVGIMARDIRQGAVMTMKVGSENTYFDSCVFIIFFILMGRALKGRAQVRTGDAIALLGNIRPQHALLVSGMKENDVRGIEVEEALCHQSTASIPVESLELGDYILVQPGNVPPADGIIVSGATSVDESSLTGESLPVFKGKGDPLMTGTTNLTSPVIIRVNEVGDQTMLQKIVQLVAEAQNHKAPIERLADSITAVFVPFVVWFSIVVLIIWLSLSLSKVIPDSYLPYGRTGVGDRIFFAFGFAISCLAVGSGLAAKAGILAQGGGEAFQMAAKTDTVVFDKTGTLTTGNTTVTHLNTAEDVPSWLFHAVRLMEAGSSHPLALAITKFCSQSFGEESDVRIESTEEVPGKGLKAVILLSDRTRHSILIGNERFVIVENGVRLEDGRHLDAVRSQQASGQTVVFVATTKQGKEAEDSIPSVMASFSISDTIRPHARTTVEQLRASGFEVFMLTGDNQVTAETVAVELGIEADNVVAGVLPQGKAEFINQLKERKRLVRPWHSWREQEKRSIVAFCGDGLNDTAALTAADVGVALAQGSQITISAAAFVLLSQNSAPASVYTLLKLSRKVYNRQKLNFGWAMVYNVILLPIAAGALFAHKHTRLSPVWAALAMALSSVSVVMSSLALQWGWQL
ncbi:haloacid dehalogenase-like hydrolase-domain-containing protein [Cantharellus anzutake]|uniref:haloacid dehalogenase-like hydrolase-domain-containing protein n=1 Tax=Cantharellus anzutake TaxID=1750568 RepID=UPI0019043E9F|nr:haloacid dehalogenase-like hydrolase-domain-containing protein [Cantharellus anzutake]KAF8338088.1 haloacid dehalogenase-like hydrolase-domain-containing protein [Cantharellus anzutake]